MATRLQRRKESDRVRRLAREEARLDQATALAAELGRMEEAFNEAQIMALGIGAEVESRVQAVAEAFYSARAAVAAEVARGPSDELRQAWAMSGRLGLEG